MKNIIFFSKNLKIGGMEKSLVSLLNELNAYYKVTLVLEKKEGALLNELSPNIKVTEYQLSTSQNVVFRKIINFTKRIIWTLKNRNKYDFSCNYATYSIIGSKLAIISSKNSAFYIHSNYYEMYHGIKKDIYNFFEKHDLDKFNKIIFVSNESKEGLEKVYPKLQSKFIVINNLMDYKNIQKKAKEPTKLNFSKNDTNLVFIGRLDNDSKNIELLLESFKLVISKSKNYKLWIIGDGPYKQSIKNFIKEKKLEDNINLITETLNPYIYLSQADALILTSNYEGFPVVYLEALVLNKRIITTIACSDETIDMKNYITLVKKNAHDIAKNILELSKELINYNLNFQEINNIKIEKLREIIERCK